MASAVANPHVRYEPNERPPIAVAIGAGLQAGLITLAPITVTVVLVAQFAGQSGDFTRWAVFAGLLISGCTTILQAVRVGRVGAGHVLIMGTSGAFIAVCVAALQLGGPPTMAALIIVSSLFQFLLASRLSLLRRIFTPAVTGTVIMLIAATVMPIVFDSLTDVPAGTPAAGPPIAAGVTLVLIAVLIMLAPAKLRVWAPVIGIAAGCAVAYPFGLFDLQPVRDASLIGAPLQHWPGIRLMPDPVFWALLPAFVAATMVGAIETVGDGVAIQAVSRRSPQAPDYRAVQGALNADGVGNLLSGLAATVPNTTYSTSVSLTDVTGIAARRVGVVIGIFLAVTAFLPKIAALLIAVPSPVVAGYVFALLALLFVQGFRLAIRDGVDHLKAVIIGFAFWLGVGFQLEAIFPELLGLNAFLSVLLSNGMNSGAIAAILLMIILELAGPRRRRMTVELGLESLPRIDEFLRRQASAARWDSESTERLTAAGEETLAVLTEEYAPSASADPARLQVSARVSRQAADLEFLASLASDEENVEDRLAVLSERSATAEENEVSFRLLQHYASSVRHQKYQGLDIVTVQVAGPSQPARDSH